MRQRIKIALIIIGNIVLIMTGLLYLYFSWVILPVNSSSHRLTLLEEGYYLIMNRVTLSHYVDGKHRNDYVLELKTGSGTQKPQSYELPELKEGMVKVTVDLEEGGNLITNYVHASNLYEKGLLIWLTTDKGSNITIDGSVYYDQYVCFLSGKERISFCEKAGSTEWSVVMDAPRPKRVNKKSTTYTIFYTGWKEKNKWEMFSVN